MLDWKHLLLAFWGWVVDHGLTLGALVIIGVLIPRIGRLLVRIVTERISRGEEQTKSYLAFVGALVYLLEIVAYFFLIYSALTNLGVSTVGATVPATVVSAAIGFGAQKVIGDFLAGFFIISEHQYGVGDFVSFDSTSDQVKGTVVRLTLRSTQIRTGNGELITVPHSSANVTINYSQEWSRAVVDLELPMTGDDTMSSLSDTVSVVTQRAIDTGGIREEIRGEVSVLPAMNITPPTAAGLPWTVGIQVTVDVNPATQWKVQRTIRAALINEFWDRFQAPGDHPSPYAGPPTEAFPPVTVPGEDAGTAAAADAVEAGEPRPPDAATPAAAVSDDGGTGDTGSSGDSGDSGDVASLTRTGEAGTTSTTSTTSATGMDAVAADVAEHGIWRNLDTGSKVSRILSLGGRIRPSTGILLLAITALAVVGLLAANPDGGGSGPLSPNRWATTTPAGAPTVTTPTQTAVPETPETAPETGTPSPAPTDDRDEGTGTGGMSTGTASPTSDADEDGGGSGYGTGTPQSTAPTAEPRGTLTGRSGGTTDTTVAP
ncbi:mechanosensitive ion channel family protein [uncultured Corynebacterium sp.]|uniref:mechanosensitive ion channel family protein n=1 Tax=uncultured Corynebacterium sp. TaxID=159447 RepID=UPI0025D27C58|nr:mechanosensitive ion channel domain-containing protein [uncultured Corynebacterium sp.]